MKDNTKKPNFYENDDINKSKHKKEIQTSSSSITYQRLFSENNIPKNKLKTEKFIVKKKSLIITIITIVIVLFIIPILFSSYIKKRRIAEESISPLNFINNKIMKLEYHAIHKYSNYDMFVDVPKDAYIKINNNFYQGIISQLIGFSNVTSV